MLRKYKHKKRQIALISPFTQAEEQEIVYLYLEEGFGCRPIAERFGRSKEFILCTLRTLNVKIRGSGTAYLIESPDDRFFKFVQKTDTCWNWTGARATFGHGLFSLSAERLVSAHRYSWEYFRGAIEENLQVLHQCDTPKCVNPDHLFLGTQADNIKDMVLKGRAKSTPQKGESNGRVKLSDAQVKQIRSCYIQGEKAETLYNRYEISKSQFYRLVSFKQRV